MRLLTGTQACLLLLVHTIEKVAGLDFNFNQCLVDVVVNATATQNLAGLFNNDGYPVANASDATAISYSLCNSVCGSGPRAFDWPKFSHDFSAWLLPNLALLSQLPFGAQYRRDDLMSAVLTIGSPALAGYSLFITLLNSHWIKRRFSQSVIYPNSRYAVHILSSLQQSPLRLHFLGVHHGHFPALVVLPENDNWWRYFSESVDYTNTWSIASATSIAWVVVAYILTVADFPSDSYAAPKASGQATGTMWLWLIPIVVGWLQLSPKCDFDRLEAAYDRADRHTRTRPANIEILPIRRALTIFATQAGVVSPDELRTPPVFNYSRSLQWALTAETAFMVFNVASENARSEIPVRRARQWVRFGNIRHIHDRNRRGTLQEVTTYCELPNGAVRSRWAPGVFTRMAIASFASITLQWGTVCAAVIVAYFTPTTRIGCRSLSYLVYGGISTLILAMLLTSSILAHYSTSYRSQALPLSARVALALSYFLRRAGKLLAILNFISVVLTCLFQYSSVYDTCYCQSSVIGRGQATYLVIIETSAQAAQLQAAWIAALVLACISALFFLLFVNLLLHNKI